jgi:hypothetical protein
LIRVDQEHHFAVEIRFLRKGKPVPVTSKLATLTPFIDASGIIRVGGRIQHACLPEDTKHPIVLSSDSQLATMIILDLHHRLTHAKTERLLHNLRATYHVLQPRATIKRVIRPCFDCKRRDSQPVCPLMGPLPASRIKTHQWPFSHVGIDYFGPLYVSMLRRTLKRYGVMFTCLDCRAVHLELADSMDLDSFMMAFSRFTDRRGVPLVCYSDNGTNLVAGEQEIRDAIAQWNPEALAKNMADRNIEWRFSPPASPHFGGSWERMIKSAKLAMRIVLKERVVTQEVLSTVMTGVEALLNARPLTPVSSDPTEVDALTPNHFLHGRPNIQLHSDFDAQPQLLSKRRWMDAQEIVNHVWNRWMREYLPSLIERTKWLRPRRNLAVGDVVLMEMPNPKRSTWPIGRIVRVEAGADGAVRSAEVEVTRAVPGKKGRKTLSDIKSKTTRYIRSAHKLCLLEADDPEDVFTTENRAGNVTDSPILPAGSDGASAK